MPEKRKERFNRLLKYAGNMITIASVIIIASKMYSSRMSLEIIFSKQNISFFAVVLSIYVVLVLIGGIPWLNFLNSLASCNIHYSEAIFIYVKSNILKYIPGNIFQYVGRNELAITQNVNHWIVALSTVADVVCYVFSGLLLSFFLVGNKLIAWLHQQEIYFFNQTIFFVCILSAIGVFLISYYVFRRKKDYLFKIAAKIMERKFLIRLLFNIIFYMISGMTLAGLYIATFSSISGKSYTLSEIIIYAGMMQMAHVIGFITPGSPGGVGVREAISLYLLKGMINETVILSGIVIMRISSIIGDFIAYAALLIFLRMKREWKKL